MKHLLFDLSCLQLGPKVGGAAAYAKRVLEELVQYPVTLYAVYDIRYCFHPVYEIPKFLEQYEIPLINIQGSSIAEIVHQYNINTIENSTAFSSLTQRKTNPHQKTPVRRNKQFLVYA